MARRSLLVLAVLVAASAAAALEPGQPVENATLPAAAGGTVPLLTKGAVNVLVFVRPGHGHCDDTLRDLAGREGQQPGVRWLAIVSGDASAADARAMASSCGVKMPFALDVGDALYARLALKLYPTILVVDREGKLAAYEPFRAINYGDRLTARIRFTLGEISQAELAAAEDPPRSDTHTEAGAARSQALFAQRLMEAGQLELALSTVEKSLARTPSPIGYVLQGRILARQGKCKDAVRAFDVALGLDPKNAEAAAEKSRCPLQRAAAP